jgi:hypothetical protein
MMNTQPEALRLADELDAYHMAPHHKQGAAELRRLHNEVTDLKQALEIADAVFKERDKLDSVNADLLDALKLARLVVNPAHAYGIAIEAAITKATGETK